MVTGASAGPARADTSLGRGSGSFYGVGVSYEAGKHWTMALDLERIEQGAALDPAIRNPGLAQRALDRGSVGAPPERITMSS